MSMRGFSIRYTQVRGIVGGGPFGLKPGQWTDDTAMALALATSLIERGSLDEADLMQRFVAWHERGEYACTGTCFDIGITTRQALTRFKTTKDPIAGSTDPRSAGNGSLMRLAPVAVRYWNAPSVAVTTARRQSATTHGAAEAQDACAAYVQFLCRAIAGESKSGVLNAAVSANTKAVRGVVAGSWRSKSRKTIPSTGYVIDSLEAALWCIGRSPDFRSAVVLAANLGDDADTVAAITGQLAGALWGAGSIPQDLLKIAWRKQLENSAAALFDASLGQ